MNKSFTYFKEAFFDTIDEQVREELCLLRTSTDDDDADEAHYEYEFDRLKHARLLEFERNAYAHYVDWLESIAPDYAR